MPFPAYGALGHAFVAARSLQILLLLVTIGLTSHCISVLVQDSVEAPGRLIGYLTISCLGILYSAFSLVLYIDSALPLLLAALCDGIFFFAFIAVSILFGENVANLSCKATDIHIPVPDDRDIVIPPALGKDSHGGQVAAVSRIMREKRDDYITGYNPAAPIPQPQTTTVYASLKDMNFGEWVRSSQRGCQMMKGAWAVGIVILVLFLVGMGSLLGLWWKLRKQNAQERKNRESKAEDNIQWST